MYSVASRWLYRNSLHEAVFLALTVVFGLQVLRVLLTGLVFHVRESLDAGSFVPGAYALLLFLLAFLAAPVFRSLGHKRALVLTAGGLALVRLVEQLVPWPVVDLGLTTLGTALFLLFIPTYIGHLRGHREGGGHTFATGLLLGIGADTAIKGIFCYPGSLVATRGGGARNRHTSGWVLLAPLEERDQRRVLRGYIKHRDFNGSALGGDRPHPIPGIPTVPEHWPARQPSSTGTNPWSFSGSSSQMRWEWPWPWG